MKEFTTIAYLLSFPGMVLAVVLLAQAFKKLFKIEGRDRIQWLVFGLAAFFCFIAALLLGDFSNADVTISTILVWFVNIFIIWFTAEKSFEKATQTKDDGLFILDQSDEDTDRFKVDLGDNLAHIGNRKFITLRVDTKTKLT